MTCESSGKDHRRFAQRVVAPVVGQNAGDKVPRAGLFMATFDIARRDMGGGRGLGISVAWQIPTSVKQDARDNDKDQPYELFQCLVLRTVQHMAVTSNTEAIVQTISIRVYGRSHGVAVRLARSS